MKAELTAIIEAAEEGVYWAICPEIPGANGQGETIEETKESLKSAIQMILEDRLEDIQRELSKDVIKVFLDSTWCFCQSSIHKSNQKISSNSSDFMDKYPISFFRRNKKLL